MPRPSKSVDLIGVFIERLASEVAARINASAGTQGTSGSPSAGSHSGKHLRRSAESMEALSGELVTYVKANPGQSIGAISRNIGQPKSSIVPTVRKLVAAKKLKTKGLKRGMKYFTK
jgi:hypothetical protein